VEGDSGDGAAAAAFEGDDTAAADDDERTPSVDCTTHVQIPGRIPHQNAGEWNPADCHLHASQLLLWQTRVALHQAPQRQLGSGLLLLLLRWLLLLLLLHVAFTHFDNSPPTSPFSHRCPPPPHNQYTP